MPDLLFKAGAYTAVNLLDGATVTSTSADANYPLANLYAQDSGKTFRFNTNGSDDLVTIDLGSAQNIDTCSIHGHNINSGVTAIRLYSKATAFSGSATDGTLEATFTKRDPAFFVHLSSPVNRRYWRVVFIGTNTTDAIELGEVVLNAASTLTVRTVKNIRLSDNRPQIRKRTGAGSVRNLNLTRFASRVLAMQFTGTRAQMDEVKDLIYVASEHGTIPVLIIPQDTDTDVLLATVSEGFEYTRGEARPVDDYTYSLQVEELGFGALIS